MKFSEKYGHTKARDVIIREQVTIEIENSIIDWIHGLSAMLYNDTWNELVRNVWKYSLNNSMTEYNIKDEKNNIRNRLKEYIRDEEKCWYEKLNLIEYILSQIEHKDANDVLQPYYICKYEVSCDNNFILHEFFGKELNKEFERHNFAYRIVGTEIIDVSSAIEIDEINETLSNPKSSVAEHLQKALKHISAGNTTPDYSGSIRESITAVEAYCRFITNTNTLGDALNGLEKKGIIIPRMLKVAFDKLYAYTNDEQSGIRHALMEETGAYAPSADEAIFMLVSCSTFINYLTKKS